MRFTLADLAGGHARADRRNLSTAEAAPSVAARRWDERDTDRWPTPGFSGNLPAMLTSAATATGLSLVLAAPAPAPAPTPDEASEPPPAAEAAEPDEAAALTIVVAAPQGDDAELDAAIETVRGALAPATVVVKRHAEALSSTSTQILWARQAGTQAKADAVVWIGRAKGDALELRLVEGGTEGGSFRRFAPGDAELSRSVTDLRAALEAQQRAGLAPIPTPAPSPESPPPEPTEAPVPEVGVEPPPDPNMIWWPRMLIGLNYEGSNTSNNIPWQSGLGLSLTWRPLPAFFTGVGYTHVFAQLETAALIEFRVQRNPVGIFLGYAGRIRDDVWAEFEGRFNVDPVRLPTRSAVGGVSASRDDLQVTTSFMGQARLRWYGWRTISLHIGIGLELLFTDFEYAFRLSDTTEVLLLTAHRVRGMFVAGFGFGLIEREGPRHRRRWKKKKK